MTQLGIYGPIAQMLPPLVIGILVQCINMPLVRATITIQNPTCELTSVGGALKYIYRTKGIDGKLKERFCGIPVLNHSLFSLHLLRQLRYCVMAALTSMIRNAIIFISAVSIGLWHGVSAGILKTVPKYVTAIVIKDFMDDHLPYGDSSDKVSNFSIGLSSLK